MSASKFFRLQLLLAFAATYFIWGSTYLFIKFAVNTLPPFLMAGIRFLVSGAILYAIAMLTSKERPTAAHWRSAAIVGILMLGIGNGLVTWAEKTVPSGLTALIISVVPLWMVLLEWFKDNRKPSFQSVAGVVLGIIGIGLLVDLSEVMPDAGLGLIGFVVLNIAALAWATGSLHSRTAVLPKSGFLNAALQMLCGGLCLTIVGVSLGETAFEWSSFSRQSIFALIYLIVFGSLVALTAYMWLIKNTAPAKATTYAFVNPAIAVFLGWAFAGEPVSSKTALALLLVIVAVVLVLRAKATQTPLQTESARPNPDMAKLVKAE